MTEKDDLVGEIIGQVAREQGIAISRDDPIIATVFLNQAMQQRALAQASAPAVTAIESATQNAVTHIEQLAEAQAQWLEQVSLKDRSTLIEEQKALLQAWKGEIEQIVAGQNAALERVIQAVVKQLGNEIANIRTNHTAALPSPAPTRHARIGTWLVSGILIGATTNTAILMAFRYFSG